MVCSRCSLVNPVGTLVCARCGEVTPRTLGLVVDTKPPDEGPRFSSSLQREVGLDRRGRGVRTMNAPLSGVRGRAQARLRARTEHLERTPRPRPLVGGAALDSSVHHAPTDPQWIKAPDSERPPARRSDPKLEAEATPALPPATITQRAGAAAIDAMVVGAVVALAWVGAVLAFGSSRLASHATRGFDWIVDALVIGRDLGLLSVVLGSLLGFAYVTLAHALAGRTLGKALVGTQLVKRSGERLTLGDAAWRALATPVSIVVGGAGLVVALFDSRRRTLHDRLVGTEVVASAPDEPPAV